MLKDRLKTLKMDTHCEIKHYTHLHVVVTKQITQIHNNNKQKKGIIKKIKTKIRSKKEKSKIKIANAKD